jgi:dihydroorotate dehydrogenase
MSYRLARPLLHLLEPERAHRAAIWALKMGLAGPSSSVDDAVLRTSVWGLDFANPIGMAAGFDKDAEVIDALFDIGFGLVEAGTVTPLPQPGNPRPRLFRLTEDDAVINRLGFNSGGLERYVARLKARRVAGKNGGMFGANVGKNREQTDAAADYVAGITAVTPYADYLVINISSPNTPGLRNLQGRGEIEGLLKQVLEARARAVPDQQKPPPLLAKVGPDLSEGAWQDIAEVALATGVDGLIIGNTTIERPAFLKSRDAGEAGGLSGKPLMDPSTDCLAMVYKMTGGRLPLIGCGGVASGSDAYRKIRAGASLVQLYSALVFHGPGLIGDIKRDLAARLRAGGFSSISDAVGADQR